MIFEGANTTDSVDETTSTPFAQPPIFLEPNDDQGLKLAATLGLESEDTQDAPNGAWYLGCKNGELALCHSNQPPLVISERSVRAKIEDARTTQLAQACNARRGRTVLDAFGGWGIDGFTLSALGCGVTILDVNPLINTMARYLARELGVAVRVLCVDAVAFLQCTDEIFDVVYLDPMFPTHPKTAKPARRMQILEQLARKGTDIDQVFALANNRTRDRFVVKRRRAEQPQPASPDWNVSGRTVRFDVYQNRR